MINRQKDSMVNLLADDIEDQDLSSPASEYGEKADTSAGCVHEVTTIPSLRKC